MTAGGKAWMLDDSLLRCRLGTPESAALPPFRPARDDKLHRTNLEVQATPCAARQKLKPGRTAVEHRRRLGSSHSKSADLQDFLSGPYGRPARADAPLG